MTQTASAKMPMRLHSEGPTSGAEGESPVFAEVPDAPLELQKLNAPGDDVQNLDAMDNKRPMTWATCASIIWLAVITGGGIALAQAGKVAAVDATTIAAYAAGIFTPITAFWLMALAVMRGGVLASEHERTQKAIGDLVSPIEAARARAVHLANALEMQIMRMSAAADAAEAKAAALDASAQREADKLVAAGDALDVFQLQVDKATERLQAAIGDAQGLIGRLEAILPETAKRLSVAASEAAVQSEALTAASVKMVDASSAARLAAESVLPGMSTAVGKLDAAGEKIAERLSLLEIQAAAAGRAMDLSAEKAADALETSRTWVEQQIETIDTSVSRVEADIIRRLEALTLSIGESSAQMEKDLPDMVQTLEHQLLAIENSMKARMEEISTSFASAVDSWENASISSTVQLVDAMSRARTMSAEATNAARDATAGIVTTVETALARATDGATSTVTDSLRLLQAQAEDIEKLMRQAEERNAAMRAILEDQVHQDFARTADQLIDRLNAYAVDITKLYSGDVTESELREYLKGDRNLFVRRFAKNMTGFAARSDNRKIVAQIAERLAREPEFADITRRYLTAFEALLKLGSHRSEQDALTVSLLTSDLGKMYIALAKAAGRMNS